MSEILDYGIRADIQESIDSVQERAASGEDATAERAQLKEKFEALKPAEKALLLGKTNIDLAGILEGKDAEVADKLLYLEGRLQQISTESGVLKETFGAAQDIVLDAGQETFDAGRKVVDYSTA